MGQAVSGTLGFVPMESFTGKEMEISWANAASKRSRQGRGGGEVLAAWPSLALLHHAGSLPVEASTSLNNHNVILQPRYWGITGLNNMSY